MIQFQVFLNPQTEVQPRISQISDAVSFRFAEMVRRDAEVTARSGKARAMIGMRRADKTYFLFF
jgi:hypothetical protein